MAEFYKVVVYDSVLFGVGHNVRRWAEAVCKRYTANAIIFAPVNSRANKSTWGDLAEFAYPGAMKANIRGTVTRVAPKHLQTDIEVNVPYAIHVIKGTGEIFPQNGPKLRLPFNAGRAPLRSAGAAWGTSTLHSSVSGQKANDFLERAHAATALKHPSIGRNMAAVFEQW